MICFVNIEHEKLYDEKHTDGRKLIANFLRLAGILD